MAQSARLEPQAEAGTTRRRKVAIVHPRLGAGGSEARALWSLQGLRSEYDLSLITCGPVDLARLNTYYGTALEPGDFHLRRVPLPPGLSPNRFTALRGHILQRYCQRVAPQFDVMISADNPVNFRVPGIQCIADFSFAPELLLVLNPVLKGHRNWWYGDSILRRSYLGLCNLISRSDPDSLKYDLVVANSKWSMDLLREKYGVESRLLYPSVADDFPVVPFEEREDGFVCIGRTVPEKRVDAVIGILGKVRQRGHDVHLHFLGVLDGSPYARQVMQLASENPGWVFLEGLSFGKKKSDLLVGHRYGIHGSVNETFGIAVAEMASAGCIPFVPNGGGQREIANHPDLIYRDDEDAVNKIDAVLSDRKRQESLLEHLRVGARRFTRTAFTEGMLTITRDFIASKKRDGKLTLNGAEPLGD